MPTYHVNSDYIGATPPKTPKAQPTAADRRGGSIEIHGDGTSTLRIASKATTVDTSAGIQKDIVASKAGPLNTPLSFFKKTGVGGSVADAEASPKEYKFVQGGTKVSLQSALNAGLVKKVGDHYYDYRATPSFRKG
jgi:hypothetical protein